MPAGRSELNDIAPAGPRQRVRRAAAALGMLALLIPTAGRTASPALTDFQRRWVEPLAAAHAARERRPLWPGYSPLFMPVLVHFEGLSGSLSGTSVLLGHPAPPTGFTLVPGLADTAVKLEDRLPISASWGLSDIGGIPSFFWRVPQGEDPHSRLPALVHENFHLYQSSALKELEAVLGASATWKTAHPAESADAMIEGMLLSRAVSSKDGDAFAAREFSTLRITRRQNDRLAARWEDYQEFLEGIATLVEIRFISETLAGDARGGPVSREKVALKLMTGFSHPDTEFKTRYYGSGAAMALLLERRGIDWTTRLSRGTPLFDLFLEEFPPLPAPEEVSARLRRGHRHGALMSALALHQAESTAARSRLKQVFADQQMVRLVLRIHRRWDEAGTVDGRLLDYDDGSWGSDASSTEVPWDGVFSLKLYDAPVRSAKGPPLRQEIILGAPKEIRVTIDGKPAGPGSELAFRELKIASPKALLRLAFPGTLRRSGSELSLDIPAKGAKP